jgi:ergothioneine biosynthesis protein EgtB
VADFGSQYAAIRSATDCLAERVSAEDQMVQSCPEASPMKWHQAHTTWFFETFVLRPYLADYKPFHEDFSRLFNSYYNSLAEQIPDRGQRASFSRPSLDQVLAFREHVDRAMQSLLQRSLGDETVRLIILGLNHEQQHQELMLTDIKHAYFSNPLHPSYDAFPLVEDLDVSPARLGWHEFSGGVAEIGHSPDFKAPLDFCFDKETPRHKVHLDPFKIAGRDITCREYLDFMLDVAYSRAELWLSEGWDAVRNQAWQAPLYWERFAADETGWRVFTLRGWHPLSALLDTPVCHVSYFEADAFARWRSCRLPTEAEWEVAATGKKVRGNLLDSGRLHPATAKMAGVQQLFGDCWQWTASAYTAYPGYRPLPGPLSEYNGKFLSSQMILRGGSCATPTSHIRPTYRNSFSPAARWQFTGIRLVSSMDSTNCHGQLFSSTRSNRSRAGWNKRSACP